MSLKGLSASCKVHQEVLAMPTLWSAKQHVHTHMRYAWKYLRDRPGYVFFCFFFTFYL